MTTEPISEMIDKYYQTVMTSLTSASHYQIIPTKTYEECIIKASELGYLCYHMKTILKACDNLTNSIQDHVQIPWRPLATI